VDEKTFKEFPKGRNAKKEEPRPAKKNRKVLKGKKKKKTKEPISRIQGDVSKKDCGRKRRSFAVLAER